MSSLDPFGQAGPSLSGIPSAYEAVTTNDSADNCGDACIGLYVTGAGTLSMQFQNGSAAAIGVPANFFVPGKFTRILATGTTATGIFALQG